MEVTMLTHHRGFRPEPHLRVFPGQSRWSTQLLMVLFIKFIYGSVRVSVETSICEYSNPTKCLEDPAYCNRTESCDPPEPGKRSHCYALWNTGSGAPEVPLKGCWLDDPDCYGLLSCVGSEKKKDQYYCCCEGNYCNSVLTIGTNGALSGNRTRKPDTTSGSPYAVPVRITMLKTLLFSLLPLVGITIFVICIFWLWRRKKIAYSHQLPTQEPLPAPAPFPPLTEWPVELIEVKARGRFGCIWRSRLNDVEVAVKVFPMPDLQSWKTECRFYTLPYVGRHDCILRFIGAQRNSFGPKSELWLITDYHRRGSLHDYLKANAVGVKELFVIAVSVCRGLAFLHGVVHTRDCEKPSIAHRDIKSRNVLLKEDMTACIADFGLALVLNQNPGDVHGQVGTRRYMAPEVLDGSIIFSTEYFLKIDVYALALVLWELLSRCSTGSGAVGDYRMPFEDEVGCHPSLEEMQDVVVGRKVRPVLKPEWSQHEELRTLCTTIEECWDQDPEARLSAECIEARLLAQLVPPSPPPNATTSAPTTLSMSELLSDDGKHIAV